MREIVQEVFDKHQVRKTKKQKAAFRDFLRVKSGEMGYSVTEEKGVLGAKNFIVGDPDSADVVYTAHYDTCPRMILPNFITPKSIPIYLLYQIVMVFCLALLPAAIISIAFRYVAALFSVAAPVADIISLLAAYLTLVVSIIIICAGPANKHTANDNTSGVTTLLCIMQDIPLEMRSKVAFVFFDLEEMGLLGSSGFASRHKASMKDKLLLNFDCVSDGDHFILCTRPGAAKYTDALIDAFPSKDGFTVEVAGKGIFYPSDQAVFPCGVGVAALKRSRGGILYMDRIHTHRDTVYSEANIEFLVGSAIRFAEGLNSN